jgi:hypothetical protein
MQLDRNQPAPMARRTMTNRHRMPIAQMLWLEHTCGVLLRRPSLERRSNLTSPRDWIATSN